MATKVFLWSPSGGLETIVEGVGGVVQSSFVVGLTVNMATNTVTDNGTTRAVQKGEAYRALLEFAEYIGKDPSNDFT